MNILVLVRTLNEERNVLPFIEAYKDWTDSILIADGGSTDRTKEVIAGAGLGDFVKVRDFTERVEYPNGVWRNPEGRHINFLLAWAFRECPDAWVIFDDCDCRPNFILKLQGRSIIEHCETQIIKAVRLYWWAEHEYFPKMSRAEDDWKPSLWAWRLDAGLRWREDRPFTFHFEKPLDQFTSTDLLPPFCLNHHAWPDLETVERKYQHYRAVAPTTLRPTEFAGHLEPLPDWAGE